MVVTCTIFSLVPATGPGAATKALKEFIITKISSFSANFDQNIVIDDFGTHRLVSTKIKLELSSFNQLYF